MAVIDVGGREERAVAGSALAACPEFGTHNTRDDDDDAEDDDCDSLICDDDDDAEDDDDSDDDDDSHDDDDSDDTDDGDDNDDDDADRSPSLKFLETEGGHINTHARGGRGVTCIMTQRVKTWDTFYQDTERCETLTPTNTHVRGQANVYKPGDTFDQDTHNKCKPIQVHAATA